MPQLLKTPFTIIWSGQSETGFNYAIKVVWYGLVFILFNGVEVSHTNTILSVYTTRPTLTCFGLDKVVERKEKVFHTCSMRGSKSEINCATIWSENVEHSKGDFLEILLACFISILTLSAQRLLLYTAASKVWIGRVLNWLKHLNRGDCLQIAFSPPSYSSSWRFTRQTLHFQMIILGKWTER